MPFIACQKRRPVLALKNQFWKALTAGHCELCPFAEMVPFQEHSTCQLQTIDRYTIKLKKKISDGDAVPHMAFP